MGDETIRQRIKYLVEHGELYPVERPPERDLFLRVIAVILSLQVAHIFLDLFLAA